MLSFQDDEIAVGRIGKQFPLVRMVAVLANLIGPFDRAVIMLRINHDVVGVGGTPGLLLFTARG